MNLRQIIPFLKVAEDRWFDWYNNIDTAQFDSNHGGIYASSRCRWIRSLLRETRKLRLHSRVLVDVGCGKGKVSFFAARYGGFARIDGFDCEPSYIKAAQNNLRVFGESPITFSVGNAMTYKLPERQSLVMMYNPFGEEIMRQFLSNNLASFKRNCHIIGYINDMQQNILIELGFQKKYYKDKNSLWTL